MPETIPSPLPAALEEWHQIEQAATKGPWGTNATQDDTPVVCIDGPVPGSATVLFEADWGTKADARFIVTARTAMPRLLAAVEAVLELADKLPPQAPPSSALEEDRMWIRQECADMIREAITAALSGTGKGASDEHEPSFHRDRRRGWRRAAEGRRRGPEAPVQPLDAAAPLLAEAVAAKIAAHMEAHGPRLPEVPR